MANDTISDPLIPTKLHRSPVPEDYVHRPRLLERLEERRRRPLTLVKKLFHAAAWQVCAGLQAIKLMPVVLLWTIVCAGLFIGIDTARAKHPGNVPDGFIHETKLESAVSLTAEERPWLKAHPNIELGYTDAFEPEIIVDRDGSYRGILLHILASCFLDE